MIGFIFSTAITLLLIGIILAFGWIILVTSLIFFGGMLYMETHNPVFLAFFGLGMLFVAGALR